MKSYKRFEIELLEEYEKVNLYSIRFHGETDTEFEKFVKTFINDSTYKKDYKKIIYWIEVISRKGALERHFRPESKMRDRICAIPIETSKLRLYCLRISDEILFLGNGGIKTSKTYNTDKHLSECVKILSSLDYFIKTKTEQKKIIIESKIIRGDLSFYLKEK